VLSRNGSYMAYRRLQEHVAAFRDYLREHADTAEGEELLAAKFMGRWRSGAPLVLAPDKDDPELGADPMRNNDYNYKEMDPFGYACPLGSHARRLNPRDTLPQTMNRRRIDPARCDLRSRAAGRFPQMTAWTAGIAAFIICAKPGPPVRVRSERLDQRQDLPRTRQRARPHLRNPGRHNGFSPSPNARSARCTRDYRPSQTLKGGAYSSCLESTHCATSPHSATRRNHHARTHLQPEPRPPEPIPGAGASASTGRGAIPGNRNGIRPRSTTASPP